MSAGRCQLLCRAQTPATISQSMPTSTPATWSRSSTAASTKRAAGDARLFVDARGRARHLPSPRRLRLQQAARTQCLLTICVPQRPAAAWSTAERHRRRRRRRRQARLVHHSEFGALVGGKSGHWSNCRLGRIYRRQLRLCYESRDFPPSSADAPLAQAHEVGNAQ